MTPPLRSPLEVVGVVLEGAEGSAEGDSPVEELEDLEEERSGRDGIIVSKDQKEKRSD